MKVKAKYLGPMRAKKIKKENKIANCGPAAWPLWAFGFAGGKNVLAPNVIQHNVMLLNVEPPHH